MKYGIGLTVMLMFLGVLPTSCRAERALWIEVTEQGHEKVVIAITEGIARALLDTRNLNINLTEDDENGLVTRQMLADVLEGRKDILRVQNQKGSEAIVYMKTLAAPEKGNGSGNLILETYKAGSRTFRMALPELDIHTADEKGDESAELNLGWKSLVPFLAKSGGAVYIRDQNDDSEVRLYVE